MRVAGTHSRTTGGSISSTGPPSPEPLFCSSTHRTSSLGGGVCACRACNLFSAVSLTLFLYPLPESSFYRTCQKSALPFAWGRRSGKLSPQEPAVRKRAPPARRAAPEQTLCRNLSRALCRQGSAWPGVRSVSATDHVRWKPRGSKGMTGKSVRCSLRVPFLFPTSPMVHAAT